MQFFLTWKPSPSLLFSKAKIIKIKGWFASHCGYFFTLTEKTAQIIFTMRISQHNYFFPKQDRRCSNSFFPPHNGFGQLPVCWGGATLQEPSAELAPAPAPALPSTSLPRSRFLRSARAELSPPSELKALSVSSPLLATAPAAQPSSAQPCFPSPRKGIITLGRAEGLIFSSGLRLKGGVWICSVLLKVSRSFRMRME